MINQDKKIVIGLMPGGVDGLVVASKYRSKRIIFKYLVPSNKEEAKWAKKILSVNDLVFYDLVSNKLSMATLDLSGVVKNSNILKKIKLAKITHLLVHHAVDQDLAKWAKKNNLFLIAPDFKLAEKLENKIWFDDFLIKNNLPLPVSQIWQPKRDRIKIDGKIVVQEPNSRGSEGTYFVDNKLELKKIIQSRKIKINRKYLVREFIDGVSYGITVFIGDGLVALSSLRVQCYGDKNQIGQKEFKGIQWLGSKSLDAKLTKKINQTFESLGESLRDIGYVGYANIDFIISGAKIYIIECNPRFAASTSQLLLFPENISNINTAKLYLEAFLRDPIKKGYQFFGLPSSKFVGSTFYFSLTEKRNLVKAYYPAGVYQLIGNKIKFIKSDITKLGRQSKSFIFYSDTQLGEYLNKDVIIGLVISNFALYDVRGNLNKYGKIIARYFRY